jgi:predicted dehydrogenase
LQRSTFFAGAPRFEKERFKQNSEDFKKMGKIKVAVIGTGHLGSQHTRVFYEMPGVELVAICDIDRKKADEVASQFNCRSYYDYRDLPLDINCVSVAVPTPLHFTISKYFLEKQKDILVEKPFTTNLKEARHLIKLAKKNSLILQVGHIERYNSCLQAIKKIINEPRFIECHRLGPYPHRGSETNVVLDLMIHDLDIVLYLVKSRLKSIDAIGVNVLSQTEDIANARLKFKNGCVCNIIASRISNEVIRKIRFFQKDAYISLDYINQEAKVYTKERNQIVTETIRTPKEEPLKNELKDFVECVKQRKNPLVTAKEATEALALAIKISTLTKKQKAALYSL